MRSFQVSRGHNYASLRSLVMSVKKRSRYFGGKRAKERWITTQDDANKDSPKKIQRSASSRKWTPPRSPFHLIQEDLFHDPWKLLVATIFLNRTGGERAIPLLLRFLERWPRPEAVLAADEGEIAALMQPIGLNNRRARVIKRFSGE